MGLPIPETQNLILRPLELSDAKDIQKYAGDKMISDTTILIPYPYEDGMAEIWIKSLGSSHVFGIICKMRNHLIGTIGLDVDTRNNLGNIGYWVGKPFWGNGYCTEAAHKILEYGFKVLNLNCIVGMHFAGNIGSGKVMQKIGMKYEGTLRQRILKYEKNIDAEYYSILLHEYHP